MSKKNPQTKARQRPRRQKGPSKREQEAVNERLLDGEVVVARAEISEAIYWKPAVVLVVALLVAIYVFPIGVILGLFGLSLLTVAVLRKEILMLVVTNKRIFVRYGILQVDVVDIHFDKVESIELERMLPGYLLGYANVVIMGTGNRLIVIPYVANSISVRRAYNEQALAHRETRVVVREDQDLQDVSGQQPEAPKAPPKKTAKDKEGNVKGENFVMKD